ncbi:MAG TPA: response regulator transcription factor [Xanthobacteraceae bacterium]|nr:response regulator transcription factor [Xanthobacteraceae bacterium]
MALAIQSISAHPVFSRAVEETLKGVKDYKVLPSASNEEEAKSYANVPRLFVLDTCSFHLAHLRALVERCRSHSAGNKFLALVPPSDSNYLEATRLFYWGIDGFVQLSETWRIELPVAVHSILHGQYWVPSEVLMALVSYVHTPEKNRLLPGHSLTTRERGILRLVMRNLTNKEISKALDISERTVKFHVSHILAKLGVENRRDLSSGKPARVHFDASAGAVDFSNLPGGALSSSSSRTRLRR